MLADAALLVGAALMLAAIVLLFGYPVAMFIGGFALFVAGAWGAYGEAVGKAAKR